MASESIFSQVLQDSHSDAGSQKEGNEWESIAPNQPDNDANQHLDNDNKDRGKVKPENQAPESDDDGSRTIRAGDDGDSSELSSLDSEDEHQEVVSGVGQVQLFGTVHTNLTTRPRNTARPLHGSEGDESISSSSDDESGSEYAEPTTKRGAKKMGGKDTRAKEVERSRNTLHINDPDFKQTFDTLRLPYFPERLEVGAPISNNPTSVEQKTGRKQKKSTAREGTSFEGGLHREKKYYDASTITQEQLVARDLWVFPNHRAWRAADPPPTKPPNFYKPLEIVTGDLKEKGDTKARLFAPPIDFRNRATIDPSKKPHKHILRHANLLRYQFEHAGYALCLPDDWERTDRLGGRPEMPEAYAKLLEEAMATQPATRESTPYGDHVSGYGPSAQNTPVKPSHIEDSDPSTKDRQPSDLPWPEKSATPLISHTGGRHSEESPAGKFSMEPTGDPDDFRRNKTDAQKYIDQEKLEPTVSAARMLASYLEPLQRAYDLEYLKLQISDLIRGRTLKGIKYLPRQDIIAQNEAERTGKPMLDGDNEDIEKVSLERLLKWLDYTGESLAKIQQPSENQVEQDVGNLLQGFFSSCKLEQTASTSLKYERHLRLFDTTPHPDLAARACGPQWDDWGDRLRLCMFCGDCKVYGARSKSDPQWAAQLAMSVGATLNVLTLMHLDTREDAFDPMPHWMWIPGIIYTEKGYTIYVHHSGVFLDQNKDWKWKHVSVKLTDTFSQIYPVTNRNAKHASASQAMSMLRSHAEFVLDQILAWAQTRGKFGEGIMDQFIARSHYDAGELNWVLNAAKGYISPLA